MIGNIPNGIETQIISVLLGIVVLTLGRKIFWLSVAVVGFIFGLSLATQLVGRQSDLVVLGIALLAGGVGAVLAIFTQKVAAATIGFFMGGYAVPWLLNLLEFDFGQFNQVVWVLLFIVGGIAGIILALSLLELALIILFSLAGSLLIVQAVNSTPLINGLMFLVLLAIGVIVQNRTLATNAKQ